MRHGRIAFVASAKFGLTQFIFRDVSALIDRGHDVRLFLLLSGFGANHLVQSCARV